MNYEYAIDNCIDDREFRNIVNSLLEKNGFISIGIDDPGFNDKSKANDNDILVMKDDVKYTIQTFLNKDISEKEINDTIKDIDKEKVVIGIIVTNKEVDNDTKELSKRKCIEIWDRTKLLSMTKKDEQN